MSPLPDPWQKGWSGLGRWSSSLGLTPALMSAHPWSWYAKPQRHPELANALSSHYRSACTQHQL